MGLIFQKDEDKRMERSEENFELVSLGIDDYKLKSSKELKSVVVEVTERDLKVLNFILEMKFSSAEEVYLSFFEKTYSGQAARNIGWAKKRLLQLERGGYLKSVYLASRTRRFYVATRKAFLLLSDKFPSKNFSAYQNSIDSRFFNHDWLVLKSRLQIESLHPGVTWISEKQIKRSPEFAFGLRGNHAPDGLYVLPNGQMFAFEMEIAQKGSRIYREKIRRYVSLLRDEKNRALGFKGVHYVVARPTAEAILRYESRIFTEYFKIESLSSFMGDHANTSLEASDYKVAKGIVGDSAKHRLAGAM